MKHLPPSMFNELNLKVKCFSFFRDLNLLAISAYIFLPQVQHRLFFYQFFKGCCMRYIFVIVSVNCEPCKYNCGFCSCGMNTFLYTPQLKLSKPCQEFSCSSYSILQKLIFLLSKKPDCRALSLSLHTSKIFCLS